MRHAVILAGGGGTRLWPASRRARPKQLLPLGPGGSTLLAATARRLAPLIPAERIRVVTAAEQEAAVRAALPELPAGGVVVEPVGRNTAAAIGLGALVAAAGDPDAVIVAVPADHHVADEAGFAAVLAAAFAAAEAEDAIVTVGIAPSRPETGFGYLALGAPAGAAAWVVDRFVEKPERAAAEAMVASGRHLWNAGIFVARAAVLRAELELHLPETAAGLARVNAALRAGGRAAAAAEAAAVYPELPAVSFDYGVMERAARVLAVRADVGWSDVGAWPALAELLAADGDGNVVSGEVVLVDAHRNVVVADPGRVVAVLGADDLVVVQAGDAILVVPRSRAQEVRAVVDALRARHLDRHL